MSRTAKTTFFTTVALCAFTVVGVHYIQSAEKAAMHAGVLRDEERTRIKRERQLDFEMQAQLERDLRKSQTVVDTTAEALEGPAGTAER
ncbi:cytochrome c oxidase assembly protein [Kalaharituber pfeilii]|nr:cytochrome c oxidase assembly protein [Kalaharituber pfeilii]